MRYGYKKRFYINKALIWDYDFKGRYHSEEFKKWYIARALSCGTKDDVHQYLKHRYSEDLDFFTEIPGAVSSIFPVLEDIGKKINLSIEARRTFNTYA